MTYIAAYALGYAGVVMLAFGNGWGAFAAFAGALIYWGQRVEDNLTENFPEEETKEGTHQMAYPNTHIETTAFLERHGIGVDDPIIWDADTENVCEAHVGTYKVEFPGGDVIALDTHRRGIDFINAVRARINA